MNKNLGLGVLTFVGLGMLIMSLVGAVPESPATFRDTWFVVTIVACLLGTATTTVCAHIDNVMGDRKNHE